MARYPPSRDLHAVVFGAGGVGKSCLTAQYVHNKWVESYDPTIEDTYRKHVLIDGRQVVLEILDTAGTEQFVAMRDLYMKSGQGFLLVFSITSSASFNELFSIRDEIIRIKDDDAIPIVLVGNKLDLEDQRQVKKARGFAISQQWGASYYETSARRRDNVDAVFEELCRMMLEREDALEEEDGGRDEGEGGLKAWRKGKKGRSGGGGGGGQKCIIL